VALQQRLAAFEQILTRRTNVLIFLIVRFVVMSAMVVGFVWTSLQLSP
jgi:hypothetical protein